MTFHARHVRALAGEVHVQIKFRRRDLLFRHLEPLRDPHAAAKARRARRDGHDPAILTLEVPHLPLKRRRAIGDGLFGWKVYLIGPTLLDMLERKRWPVASLPPATHRAWRRAWLQSRTSKTEKPPRTVMAWSIRDLTTLWPRPGEHQFKQRETKAESTSPRAVDHPFLVKFASGGTPIGGSVGDWIAVEKLSTCQVSEHVYRVASGVFGGLDQAYARIAATAVAAWEADLARALQLWERVRAAPGEVLVEDELVAGLRPLCSISQDVERAVMREVCAWLGIDPEMSVARPRGRPKSNEKAAEQGQIVRVELRPDGSVKGLFIADFEGVASGTEFHELALRALVAMLGAMRTRNLETDANLLEAWLDAAIPDWRDRVADAAEETGSSAATSPDPYEVLGVERSAAMGRITAAYHRAVNAVHPDKSGASTWLVRMVVEAYQKIRAERAVRGGEQA